MLQPKFALPKGDRLYITDKYICNGHWMVTRAAAASHAGPKAFKPALVAMHGSYFNGLAGGLDRPDTMDVTQAIPKREGYLPMNQQPIAVKFRNDDWISAYIFECADFKIGINPNYVPLLRLGHAFAKDAGAPILILNGDSLNDELVGVVMPMRLDN